MYPRALNDTLERVMVPTATDPQLAQQFVRTYRPKLTFLGTYAYPGYEEVELDTCATTPLDHIKTMHAISDYNCALL